MRRGGERSSRGKPAPTRPRGRSRTARTARGGARARHLDCGRRPRSGRAGLPSRRPPLHPLDRGRAGDRAARRRARDRRASSRPAPTGRSASPRASRERVGLPHPISPETAVLATNKLRQRERLERGGRAAAAVVGRRRRRRGARGLGAGRRQGARPAGPEGADARHSTPRSCPAAIETARGARAERPGARRGARRRARR